MFLFSGGGPGGGRGYRGGRHGGCSGGGRGNNKEQPEGYLFDYANPATELEDTDMKDPNRKRNVRLEIDPSSISPHAHVNEILRARARGGGEGGGESLAARPASTR